MDIEKKTENEFSPENSVDIDKIIDFYKDIEPAAEDEKSTEPTETPKKSVLDKFFKNNRKKENSEIKSEVYGLSDKGRMRLYRIISAAICLFIIASSFVLAYFLPGNEEVIAEQQNELRKDEDYESLKSRYEALKTEVDNLKTSNKEKKSKIDKIDDFDNSKADLRTQITAKTYELNELNAQINEKKTQIEALDKSISEKIPPETVLPPGKYVVGKNIAAGKYLVTGTGKFMVANAAGKSKENTTLGSTPLEITLEDKDIIKFDSKVKFTAKN